MDSRQEQNLKDLNASLTERLKALTIELQSKNRQLEIEAALEKVRIRATAMRISSELAETSAVLFQQLNVLNIKAIRTGVGIFDDANDAMEIWLTTLSHSQEVIRILDYVNLHIHPVYENIIPARKQHHPFAVTILNGEQVRQYYETMSTYLFLAQQQNFNPQEYFYSFFFSEGTINITTLQALTEEECNIMIRFSQVFGLIYTRFLDLQKAETRGREAQIELGLERVRAEALAMQKSDDLANAVSIIFEELDKLNLGMLRCGIGILNKETHTVNVWAATTSDKNIPVQLSGDESMDTHPLLQGAFDAWLKQEDYSYELEGQDLNAYYKAQAAANFKLPESQLLTNTEGLRQYYFLSTFQAGGVFAFRDTPFPEEAKNVMKRFAGVLNLTYKRFADLQKAEAQARDARIEAVLERVRSRTMAMQKSDELTDVAGLLFEQVSALGIKTWTAGFNVWSEDNNSYVDYITSPNGGFIEPYTVETDRAEALRELRDARKSGVEFNVQYSEGERIKELYRALTKLDEKQYEVMLKDGVRFPSHQYEHFVFGSKVSLMFITYEPVPEAHDIFKRLGKVFEQTYTRFLDLQKAEGQAREAQIELGLERVRARAMRMQKSDELAEAAELLYHEFGKLGINTFTCGYLFIDEARNVQTAWVVLPDGTLLPNYIDFPLTGDRVMDERYKAWKEKKPLHICELEGKENKEHHRFLANHVPAFVVEDIFSHIPDRIIFYCANFSNGYLLILSTELFSPEVEQIIIRFANVFEMTYTRFNDLKLAEAQAREAIKASSQDRIRAEIASMRTAGDLQRIGTSIWRELTTLGLPFFRCGIFIINEKEEQIHSYLSTPDGKPLGVLHLDFTSSEVTSHVADHWRQQKVYIEHWNREQFSTWAQSLIGKGQIKDAHVYQGGDEPPELLSLQFIPFIQGMLYVGSANPLSETQLELVKALADAFSVAYARYEDFTKLEEAKGQVEKTLTDLKATQSQLIQSEKMASLGALTAGVAHEIQNPINFVNNFSEVTTEMLDEMEKEFTSGNKEEGAALVSDIKQNLEKILHHGQRADAIVKGMLQHARSSTGKKEPADINALAEEYFSLAYHGLRAKNKDLCVTMKTDFDKSIGKINIIPQDIGRVMLNVINNAFYAVTEKKKAQPEGFEPIVSVSTKKTEDKISISVKDNGIGIPQQIADKIFQPFFTTKPAGQGTGLGLSLSYDIIKAHGGEWLVQTKDGEGSEFVIILPLLSKRK